MWRQSPRSPRNHALREHAVTYPNPTHMNGSCASPSRISATRPLAPLRKSTGFVAISTRMPAGTVIIPLVLPENHIRAQQSCSPARIGAAIETIDHGIELLQSEEVSNKSCERRCFFSCVGVLIDFQKPIERCLGKVASLGEKFGM